MAVPQMFNAISNHYDTINRVLSLGLDRYWRSRLAQEIPTKKKLKLLDLATGTGDLLRAVLKKRPNIYDAVGCDPAREMLKIATEKLSQDAHRCKFVVSPAEMLPFPDQMFDVITTSFGIRNFSNLTASLGEIYRTLNWGGKLIILEFSHPSNKLLRYMHRWYLNTVVPRVGKLLSGHNDAYNYLSQTIESFPQGEALAKLLKEAGFTNVIIKPLSFGIVSLYIGEKNDVSFNSIS